MFNSVIRDISAIASLDRTVGSNGYSEAANYIFDRLSALASVQVRRVTIDTTDWHGTWKFPDTIRHWMDDRNDKNIHYNLNSGVQVIEARIPGRSKKELLLVTHFCHPIPGANDNASGVAGQLAICDHYSTHAPDLTLVCLFTAEYWGTIGWAVDYDFKDTLGAISLDMLGGGCKKTGSSLLVDEMPYHQSSGIDLILFANLNSNIPSTKYRMIGERVNSNNIQLVRGIGGSDHSILNDFSFSVPSTCLNTFPDRYYHTADDTVDKIDIDSVSTFLRATIQLIDSYENDKFRPTTFQLLRWFVSNIECVRCWSDIDSEEIDLLVNYLVYIYHKKSGDDTLDESGMLYDLADNLLRKVSKKSYSELALMTPKKYYKTYVGPIYRANVHSKLSESTNDQLNTAYQMDKLVYVYIDAALNLIYSGVPLDHAHILASFYTKTKFDKSLITRYIKDLSELGYIQCA